MANSCFLRWMLLLVLFVINPACTALVYVPSDAYQESLLRPFHSYRDVVIFHFSVPTQTIRAIWQFVAFMDDPSCASRNVHIYLRYGSYPVISPDNATFPENMLIPTEHLYSLETISHFQPREMSEFHLMNPLPGSWYAVAFIPDWNHEIKQQGISHKCRYSLGSMASWNRRTDIHLLNPTVTLEISPISIISLFKIFVPEDTWAMEIEISNCSPSNNSAGSAIQSCVSDFGIRAHALPFPEHINITNDSNEFLHIISQPETDAYYYIMIISEPHVTFTITANLQACSLLWYHNKNKFNQLPTSDEQLSATTKSLLSWLNLTQGQKNRRHFPKGEEIDMQILMSEWELADGCLPIIPLTRIKHAQDFLDSFLIQGHDWFSSWLSITDIFPILVKFELLPFIDIGGTLQTKIHLDGLIMNLTSQVVKVSMCIHQGSPPVYQEGVIQCHPDYSMIVASNESSTALKYFPFPQPGMWFISFTASCFNHTGATVSEPCEVERVMVDLRIHLQPCVFEGTPCGIHGYCQENHFRQFYFSSCHCLSGFQGWGCTDDRNASTPSLLLLKTLLLTLSNLFFVPAVILAIKRRYYTEAVVYTVTMFFSTFYHACDVDIFSFCLMKYEVLQYCDFYSAILSFWVTLIAMADLPQTFSSIAHMIGALGIALGVEYQRTGIWVFIIPVMTGIVIMLFSWGRKCYYSKACFPVKVKWLLSLLPGTILAAVGLILFAFVETEDNYKYVHSVWHMVIALSVIFFLPTEHVPPIASSRCNGEQMIFHHKTVTDSELTDIGEYRLNSDLSSLIGELR